MFLRTVTPLLETDSIHQTIEFYTSVLDFNLMDSVGGEGQLRWCALQKNNTWLMFTARNAGKQSPVMTGDLYFHVTGIDEAWEQLKDKAAVVQPLMDMPYNAREFAISDNNGYTLKFGMGLKAASDFDKWFPQNLSLESDRVQLRILQQEDIEHLKPLTPSDTTWKYFVKSLDDEQSFYAWMNEALNDYGSEKRVPFVIIDKQRNAYAGSTSFGNVH